MKNVAALIVFLFGVLPSIVLADSSQEKRIDELEREVRTLRGRVEALEGSRDTPGQLAAVASKPGNSKDIGNWRKLRMDMTETEVEKLLGAPGRVETNRLYVRWYFNYPRGEVRFDTETRRVNAWNEP